MSVVSDITIDDDFYQGEDQIVIWQIHDREGNEVDVSTYTIQFKMATTKTGSSVLTKSAAVGSSLAEVDFDAADTSAMSPANYFYTLSRTNTGYNTVLAHGRLLLQARVA